MRPTHIAGRDGSCFTQSTNSNASLIWKHHHRNTQKHCLTKYPGPSRAQSSWHMKWTIIESDPLIPDPLCWLWSFWPWPSGSKFPLQLLPLTIDPQSWVCSLELWWEVSVQIGADIWELGLSFDRAVCKDCLLGAACYEESYVVVWLQLSNLFPVPNSYRENQG